MTKMVESSQQIYEYMDKLHFDETKISQDLLEQKNILGDDPLMLSRNFNEIIRNFRIYTAYVFGLLIVFLSIGWALTRKFMEKMNLRHLTNTFLRNLIILLFYLGLIFLFLFSLLNISIVQLTTESSAFFSKFIVFIAASIILSYFMFISSSLAGKVEFRNMAQKTLVIGVKKAHYVLASYIICILFLAIPSFLAYYFFEKNILIFFLSLIMIIFSFVFGRILAINVISKLEN